VDSAVVKNAVGALDKLLSQTKRALWEVELEVYGDPGYGDDQGGYEYPRFALAGHLEELHDILLVILEAAQMPEARNSLVKAWSGFTAAKDGLRHTDDDDEGQNCQSPALTFVERLIIAMRMTVRAEILSEEAWTLAKLEAMLEDTPGLIHRRRKALGNEADLQEIMHDYLSASFPDFRLNPPIGGTIKNFKPDCGIASVGAAIEFKLAHTKQQAIVSFTGVVEDTGGYKGSKDWTRFYAVMYQAKPFILKSHLRSDMKRIGASTWKAVLVNGDTKPKISKKHPPIKKKIG
jgi:hypothetical protein